MCFKITHAQREYFRYQGVSAELERRGYGSSRPEFAWANRLKTQNTEASLANRGALKDTTQKNVPRGAASN